MMDATMNIMMDVKAFLQAARNIPGEWLGGREWLVMDGQSRLNVFAVQHEHDKLYCIEGHATMPEVVSFELGKDPRECVATMRWTSWSLTVTEITPSEAYGLLADSGDRDDAAVKGLGLDVYHPEWQDDESPF